MGFWKKIQKLQVKDLDINNKNSAVREGLREIDEHVFQPTWDQLGGLLIDPVANAYIEFVEEQAKGKYQPLPQWLKLILSEDNSYDIDLSRVSYAEGINTLQADNAITFGYNIHFPRAINLEREGLVKSDVWWILHELEHCVQYKALGGIGPFLAKYYVNSVVAGLGSLQAGTWEKYINKIHSNLQIEKDADSKAISLIDSVMSDLDDLSLSRPTVLGSSQGSRINCTNQTIHEGEFLESNDGRFRFICQFDGNVVLYGPGNSVLWKSSTDGIGKPPYRIVAQDDRNIVQYDRENRAIWRTGTSEAGHLGCFLVLQNDGNLVLYQSEPIVAVWHTHTPGH
jgi:hypothetical protein